MTPKQRSQWLPNFSSLLFCIGLSAIAFEETAALHACTPREACRVVDYRPVIPEDSSGLRALELQSSGANAPIAELDYGDGLANEVPTAFPYEETTFTVNSHQVCECATGFECPDENSTDTERSVRLDTFTELKLCVPKIRYPTCRDFRRPVVRLFKDVLEDQAQTQSNQSPSDNQMRYAKATIWCRCESGRFGKTRNVEIWMNGRQHAVPYVCSRNRAR